MTRRNWLLGAFALVVLGVVAAVALVTIKPTTPASVSKAKRSAPASANKSSAGGMLMGTTGGDILDDTTTPGIPLETAREQAADGILIPSSKVLGKITRVRLAREELPKELVGIGILYDSGVKFFARPSGDKNKTFESTLRQGDPGSFTDGRKQVYDVVEVGGRKYCFQKGGTQVFGKGTITFEVKPCITFVVDGIEYWLIAASGNLKASDLLNIAQEIH